VKGPAGGGVTFTHSRVPFTEAHASLLQPQPLRSMVFVELFVWGKISISGGSYSPED
jgi:hypothetical protein